MVENLKQIDRVRASDCLETGSKSFLLRALGSIQVPRRAQSTTFLGFHSFHFALDLLNYLGKDPEQILKTIWFCYKPEGTKVLCNFDVSFCG